MFWKAIKRKVLLHGVAVAGSSLLFSTITLGAMVEARRPNTKIYAKPSSKSAVLATLSKGDALDSIERRGMYWAVKLDRGEGYVSVMAVKHKASDSGGGLAKAIRKVVNTSRSTDASAVRSRSVVMGVRGLADGNAVSAGSVRPNLRAVYAMEDELVSTRETDQLGRLVFREIRKKARR